MQNLSEAARGKAIEIANALLAQGMDEGKAIRIAIAKSRQWALHRGVRVREGDRNQEADGRGLG
jgi:uncharacterized protein YdaT